MDGDVTGGEGEGEAATLGINLAIGFAGGGLPGGAED